MCSLAECIPWINAIFSWSVWQGLQKGWVLFQERVLTLLSCIIGTFHCQKQTIEPQYWQYWRSVVWKGGNGFHSSLAFKAWASSSESVKHGFCLLVVLYDCTAVRANLCLGKVSLDRGLQSGAGTGGFSPTEQKHFGNHCCAVSFVWSRTWAPALVSFVTSSTNFAFCLQYKLLMAMSFPVEMTLV